MRKIIENLQASVQFSPAAGTAYSTNFELYTLGSQQAYLLRDCFIGLENTSAAPSVTGAGAYRFEVSIAGGDRTSAASPALLDNLYGTAGISGGALAAKDVEFPHGFLELYRVLPTLNLFMLANCLNITNAATVEILALVHYDIVSLSLREVNDFLTR